MAGGIRMRTVGPFVGLVMMGACYSIVSYRSIVENTKTRPAVPASAGLPAREDDGRLYDDHKLKHALRVDDTAKDEPVVASASEPNSDPAEEAEEIAPLQQQPASVHADSTETEADAEAKASTESQADTETETSTETSCPSNRKMYHVIMTAASGIYQEWQSRIAYYHYKKQKKLHPCSEMGGFTRLVNLPHESDGLVNEMPSVVVKQLNHGSREGGDYGFIVMNRPWGMMQMIETDHWKQKIPEEYVLIMETDHVLMRPPPNDATEEKPVGFKFYYMNPYDAKLMPVVQKYWSGDLKLVDPTGPSPVIIHKRQIEKLTPSWWDYSLRMKRDDRQANVVFGWVLEMWGYVLAAANMGIKHKVWQEFQAEPQGTGMDGMDNYQIYHYTFDIHAEGGFRVSKRQFFGGYMSKNLPLPPPCTSESHTVLVTLFNEATGNLPNWHSRDAGGLNRPPAQKMDINLGAEVWDGQDSSPVAQKVLGTGPWEMTIGAPRATVQMVFIMAHGRLTAFPKGAAPKPSWTAGRWHQDAKDPTALELELCGGTRWKVSFNFEGQWTVSGDATRYLSGPEGSLHGFLAEKPPDKSMDMTHPTVKEIYGSGPWAWAGSAPAVFLQGGVFHAPWGRGQWGPVAGEPRRVFANFLGIEHTLQLVDKACGKMLSVRKSDGDRVPVTFVLEKDITCH